MRESRKQSKLWMSWALLAILMVVLLRGAAGECPAFCHNGGYCEEGMDACVCPDRQFTGRDCAELACGLAGPPDSQNKCHCGGTGFHEIDCLSCETDQACNEMYNTTNPLDPHGGIYRCSKDLIPKRNKRFFCESTFRTGMIIGPNVTFECTNITNSEESFEQGSECLFQSWAYDIPVPLVPTPGYQQEIMDCRFSDCYWKQQVDKKLGLQLLFKCKTSKCKCLVSGWNWPASQAEGMYCDNKFVKDQIALISGPSDVVCNPTDPKAHQGNAVYKDCTLKQSALKAFEFPLQNCRGSECYRGNSTYFPPAEVKSLWWVGLVITGCVLSVLGVTFIVSVVVSIVHSMNSNKEYRKLKGKRYGAKVEWKDLSYWLKVKSGPIARKVQILHGLTHTVYPGQVLAIMGASGAGKTTCLDILANRNKRGTIKGTRLLNDKKYTKSFSRFAGYVSQDDSLMGTLTVRESLQFAADVKLPTAISQKEKKELITELLHKLKIYHIKDRKIGGSMSRGISGGERRRVAVAMELVGNPHVLFLDEPTSGLDSASAYTVIHELVQLAKNEGKTIIFSIHQPRSNIYALFDELMLLSHGRICYAGPAQLAEPYFNSLGYKFPAKANLADSLIDLIVKGEHENFDLSFNPDQLQQVIQDNPHLEKPSAEVEFEGYGAIDSAKPPKEEPSSPTQSKEASKASGEKAPLISFNSQEAVDEYYDGTLMKYGTSFYTQLYALSVRAFRNFLRHWLLFPAHYASSVLIGLLLGTVYWQQTNDLVAIQNRFGSMFFMLSVLSFTSMSSLELFISERSIYVSERANGYYTGLAYFFSKVLFDIIPLRILPAAIMGAISYFMIGLRHGIAHFLWFELILILFNVYSSGLCFCIASIAPNVGFANVVTIVLTLGTSLFGGFLLSLPGLPNWMYWMHYLSPYYYACEALFTNDLSDLPIVINPKATNIVIDGTGEFVLEQLGMHVSRFSVDVSVIGAMAVVTTAFAALLLILFVKERR